MTARPLIGITTSLTSGAQALDARYVEAVERAGGAPLILPMPRTRAALEPVTASLDGLVITGGPGILHGLVGVLPEDLPPVCEQRWQADVWAFDALYRAGRPVLGICYGMQFLNARLGGTLLADVQQQRGVGPHTPRRTPEESLEHEVLLEPGTHLARVLGPEPLWVNSHHIQAVASLAPGLAASARSPDGVVEGIESADGLLLGVQFHPERLPGTRCDQLFAALVAQAHTGRREAPPHPRSSRR
ncbi:MAG: gamma-glutamyl-gamma-aminobutyrate hydrolase family protein [Candidatus Latescibacterota bacterium]